MESGNLLVLQLVAFLFGLLILYSLGKSFYRDRKDKLWKSLPTVGIRDEWLQWWGVLFRSLTDTRDLVFEGYAKVKSIHTCTSGHATNPSPAIQQYSKLNAFFGVATMDRGRLLVIPPGHIKQLYSLPESVLDVTRTGNESIQTKWTIWDDEVSENNFQMNVIRKQLTQNLDLLTPTIAEELEQGFERHWGSSTTEWKEISVWNSALHIVAGAANGAFCGKPLCK